MACQSVLVSIWGLETGFGADTGHFKTMQALATLAYDCRRSAQFTEELKDALKIIQRGDMSPAQMRGQPLHGEAKIASRSHTSSGVHNESASAPKRRGFGSTDVDAFG